MKTIRWFVCAVLLACLLAIPAWAENPAKVIDGGELLSPAEESALTEEILAIGEAYQFDVVIVTENGLGGKTPREYADDYYDYNGYGYDSENSGILLLLDMEQRDWYISTTGSGIRAFTDYGIQVIGEKIVPDLSSGNYYGAFSLFLEQVDLFLAQAAVGQPFDTNNRVDAVRLSGLERLAAVFGISLLIAFVIALIAGLVMRARMNTARRQAMAGQYVQQGSFRLTEQRDIYLYSHTSRIRRPQQNNSGGGSSVHMGSSGTSHGGGGGKF